MNLFCKKFCFLSLFGIVIFSCSGILFSWDNFHNDIGRTGFVDRSAPGIPELDWEYNTGSRIYSSPVVYDDGTIFIASYDGVLHAINPDGSVKWARITNRFVNAVASLPKYSTGFCGWAVSGVSTPISRTRSSRPSISTMRVSPSTTRTI